MRVLIPALFPLLIAPTLPGQLTLRPDVLLPDVTGFHPLPPSNREFTEAVRALVVETDLHVLTPAEANPDRETEWSSVCVVDITDPERPRVAGWQMENFIYPASAYKLYVLGEAVRQISEGQLSLDDTFVVESHNVRAGSRLEAGQEVSLSELLRLMMMYSDNTASNVCIDIVDRQRASALMRALGCEGSDITRKFLPRSLEDEGYDDVPGTASNALHFATFLWASETGAIGGGHGRGLIRAYLSMKATGAERIRAGLPDSATLMSKTGTWDTFTCECGVVEDGPVHYIICVMTALPSEVANPRIAEFTARLHALLKEQWAPLWGWVAP